jgi:hypothetical protein
MVQIVERVPNDNYCANRKRRMLADFIQKEMAGMTFARHPNQSETPVVTKLSQG